MLPVFKKKEEEIKKKFQRNLVQYIYIKYLWNKIHQKIPWKIKKKKSKRENEITFVYIFFFNCKYNCKSVLFMWWLIIIFKNSNKLIMMIIRWSGVAETLCDKFKKPNDRPGETEHPVWNLKK